MNVPNWHKSSYSGDNDANCVEVADNDVSAVLVRDTKDHGKGVLAVTPAGWSAFVDFAKQTAV
ncbi:DUF397 domain-containing protein [Streptomyces lydicus]|uniref:DUF397 domain-containing protein n=1 Tax=Streptomyces lydicus TaxID=47763 RepID=UPI0037A179EC